MNKAAPNETVTGKLLVARRTLRDTGFVARLKDRRRIHVDGRAGRAHWSEEDSDIEAGLLNEGEHHPELGARYGWQRHAWDDATARRLNELLDRFDAPEGEP